RRPFGSLLDQGQVGDDRARRPLDSPMSAIDVFGNRIAGQHAERILNFFVQLSLIPFHGQNVVSFLGGDLPGDTFLAAHGVDRDHRSAQLQRVEQLGIAVISLDFSSTRRCPTTNLWVPPQAETMCTMSFLPGSQVPRSAFPSMATTSPAVNLATDDAQATKPFSNSSGSRDRK